MLCFGVVGRGRREVRESIRRKERWRVRERDKEEMWKSEINRNAKKKWEEDRQTWEEREKV